MARIRIAATLLAIASLSSPARAQFERYELGRRVRALEFAWDATKAPEARTEASRSLKNAVSAFFAAKQGEAARFVTDGLLALRPGGPPSSAERWAAAVAIKPERRLLDASADRLDVVVSPFYAVGGPKPEGLAARLTLGPSVVESPIADLPATMALPLKGIGAGDHLLKAEIIRSGEVLARAGQVISIVDRLDARVAAVKATVDAWPKGADSSTIDRESVRSDLGLLTALAAGKTLESDVAAATLLDGLERHADAAGAGRPYLGKDRPGQAWVTIPRKGGRTIATRIFVPEAARSGQPIPLVVALHGAGGSENMFFETYGHGRIVDLCRERGWMLVAPRGGGFGGTPVAEVVDGLATIYPIDTKRVMLVGHSMGAAGAVGAAQVEPSRYAAVAALGGGGAVRPVEGLKRLPFFVGVGTEDFALRGSRGLVASLKRAEVANLEAREYPNIEHLAIVQVALDDVFAFFERHAR